MRPTKAQEERVAKLIAMGHSDGAIAHFTGLSAAIVKMLRSALVRMP